MKCIETNTHTYVTCNVAYDNRMENVMRGAEAGYTPHIFRIRFVFMMAKLYVHRK